MFIVDRDIRPILDFCAFSPFWLSVLDCLERLFSEMTY